MRSGLTNHQLEETFTFARLHGASQYTILTSNIYFAKNYLGHHDSPAYRADFCWTSRRHSTATSARPCICSAGNRPCSCGSAIASMSWFLYEGRACRTSNRGWVVIRVLLGWWLQGGSIVQLRMYILRNSTLQSTSHLGLTMNAHAAD